MAEIIALRESFVMQVLPRVGEIFMEDGYLKDFFSGLDQRQQGVMSRVVAQRAARYKYGLSWSEISVGMYNSGDLLLNARQESSLHSSGIEGVNIEMLGTMAELVLEACDRDPSLLDPLAAPTCSLWEDPYATLELLD